MLGLLPPAQPVVQPRVFQFFAFLCGGGLHGLEAVDELIAETGDQKLCCFEFIPINVMFEGYGAMGHPSAKTHVRMGKELAHFLRSKVNQ